MPLLWPLLLLVALTSATGGAWGQSWRLPVPAARVAAPFAYDRAQPFARGARRGVDLRVPPGAPVAAACGGRVTYAGRVPGHGLGVTVRCGALAATELGLRSVSVRRGDEVLPGAPLGAAGARGVVRLGARRRDDRWGWVDPLLLVRGERPRLPLVGRAPRAPRPILGTPPARHFAWRAARDRPVAAPAQATFDATALVIAVGVVLLLVGVPLHLIAWRRRPFGTRGGARRRHRTVGRTAGGP
jgi:hypothetical protein